MVKRVLIMKRTTCKVCKKPLKNYTSIKFGMGRVCRGRFFQQPDIPGLFDHAEYSIVYVTDTDILIRDTGYTYAKTVAHDVAHVLEELSESYDLTGKRVFYIDSENRTVEIIHNGNRFIGFKPWNYDFSELKNEVKNVTGC
jgi:hypothetical protein